MDSDVLVRTVSLKKYYEVRSRFLKRVVGYVRAVDGVDLEVRRGETIGIVGESGSGKTTLGLVLAKLLQPTDGSYLFKGIEITRELPRNLRGKIRIVFQDPYSALNPRLRIEDSIIEPLVAQGYTKKEAVEKSIEYLKLVGLNEQHLKNYPHMLSGGQRQRVVIARALISEPEFIILDEPTSMLDVSTQAQILQLLKDIKIRKKLTYLFITHNLAVARYISDTIAVMFAGHIVEIGSKESIFSEPLNPYTRSLISAYPSPDPTKDWRPEIPDEIADAKIYESGCRYADRCPLKRDVCMKYSPELLEVEKGHKVRCHLYSTL
ncbi:MAG: ABC transporter ATP-binding protein [Ignisphaera sp.]|nr:ABC transporter ATP-binding protein [Ignisphaera sp.]MDW8085701.1 ABC transporter ATP-binding protein [Ignisphaera sp.]